MDGGISGYEASGMRNVSVDNRKQIEIVQGDAALLAFATLSHPQLSEPIRVVNNTVDVVFEDFNFVGFPFELKLLTDSETVPKGNISFQNVDRRIGNTILALKDRIKLRIQVAFADDLEDPWLDYNFMEISNVHLGLATISGDITVGQEFLQDLYPATRTQQLAFPGVYR